MILYPPVKQPVVWLCPPAHFLKKMPEAATVNLYIWKNQIVACSFDSSQLQFSGYTFGNRDVAFSFNHGSAH